MDYHDASIDRLIERASQQYRYGDHNGAIETLKTALGLAPDVGFLHSFLAFGLLKQKRLAAAHHEAQIGLSLEPNSGYSHYVLSMLLCIKREFVEALVHVEQALANEPENVAYLGLLGEIQLENGNKLDAKTTLERAMAIAPDDADVLTQYGELWLTLNDKEKAEFYFNEALNSEPQHINGLLAKAGLLLHKGLVNEAREHVIWVLQQDPNNYAALRLLTSIKARQSPFMGLWWRMNAWLVSGNNARTIILMIFAYLLFRLTAVVLTDFGYETLGFVVSMSWLVIVAYTWVGPGWFQKKLKAELATVSLNKGF